MFSSYNTKIEICQKNYRINYNKDMHFELNKEHVSSMTYGIEQRTRFFFLYFLLLFWINDTNHKTSYPATHIDE